MSTKLSKLIFWVHSCLVKYLTPSCLSFVSESKSRPFSIDGVLWSSFFSQYQSGILTNCSALLCTSWPSRLEQVLDATHCTLTFFQKIVSLFSLLLLLVQFWAKVYTLCASKCRKIKFWELEIVLYYLNSLQKLENGSTKDKFVTK